MVVRMTGRKVALIKRSSSLKSRKGESTRWHFTGADVVPMRVMQLRR